MAYIITVDGGTTNTRCILWDDKRNRITEEKREVGVRNTSIDGNNQRLKDAVKDCLNCLVEKNGISFEQIRRIIASGMITSDVGIVEVPHLIVPASIEDMAAATKPILLPEICPIPIYFIPGIKNSSEVIDFDNFEGMDIMRGEEVESAAIIDRMHEGKPLLLVLPGSHNKFVAVNAEAKITGCLTSISGELLFAITNNTILAKSVGKRFVEESEYDKEWLLEGYKSAKKCGLGRVCFSGRILYLFHKDKPDTAKIANYILGATLQGDIQAVLNSDAVRADKNTTIVVAGKNPLRQAIVDIMEYEGEFAEVKTFVPEEGMSLSALGAYIIADKSKIL